MKTYGKDDALNRKEFGDLLYGLIRSEYILADNSYVVALTGGFGSGKSHFLEMWECEIRNFDDCPMIVHINAWESDHSGEPVLAIVSAIAAELQKQKTKQKKALATLKSSASRVARGGLSLAKDAVIGYLENQTGVELDEAWEKIKEDRVKNLLGKSAMGLFDAFEARQQAVDDLKSALRELVVDSQHLKIILVVDELDRCRPTYAIDFLESLKHFFDIKGLAALLAVDWNQIGSTAKALFGQRLNTSEYLRKFVSRRVNLPAPGLPDLRRLTQTLWLRLLESETLSKRNRFTFAPRFGDIGNLPSGFILGLGVTRPRQIEEVFRIMSHYFHTDLNQPSHIRDNQFLLLIFLVCLHVVSPNSYDGLVEGTTSAKEILKLVFQVTRERAKDVDWSGEFIEKVLVDSLVDQDSLEEIKKLYMESLTEQQIEVRTRQRCLPHFSNHWSESEMRRLARKLDSLRKFSNQ